MDIKIIKIELILIYGNIIICIFNNLLLFKCHYDGKYMLGLMSEIINA